MNWTTDSIPDLDGKVIVVTGGNSGLGYESVKALAAKGASLVLASRSPEKGEAARSEILRKHAGARIRVMALDLGDLTSVRKFSDEFRNTYDKLDVLLNNAGIMMTPYFKTQDGFEGQFGINHLGHFALTGLMLESLLNTPGSRIVNVSSMAHKRGVMDFKDLQFENGDSYTPMKAYGRSKLANLLFTLELQRRLEESNSESMALAAHPGVATTNLARHMEGRFMFKVLNPLFKKIAQDQAMGALPQIRATVDPLAHGGEYYGPDGRREMKGYPVLVSSSAASRNKDDAARLWEESVKLTGIDIKIQASSTVN